MAWLGLERKAAIVTGGASGIGKTICHTLAQQGASVAIADVNQETGTEAVEELKHRHGGDHIFEVADVTDSRDVEGLVAKTVAAFGKIDILVNNAGINVPRLLVDPAGEEELTDAIWDKVVAVNLKGVFLCTQAAARSMIQAKRGGAIINMASESGLEGSEGQSVYAATKAAIYSLTRSWAKELGRHGIRVTGVAPGILEATAMRSEGYERALAHARGITAEQLRAAYEKVSIPLGRAGTLQE
ncbi:unnamed protein product, partial [marine sediment metagenome]